MTHPDMSPALRDHMRAMHFIAHPRPGVAALTDEQRERIHRAVHYGESMGWKPTHIGEEPPF